MVPKPRVLVIRGGAIGDFILALPALNALRDATSNPRVDAPDGDLRRLDVGLVHDALDQELMRIGIST